MVRTKRDGPSNHRREDQRHQPRRVFHDIHWRVRSDCLEGRLRYSAYASTPFDRGSIWPIEPKQLDNSPPANFLRCLAKGLGRPVLVVALGTDERRVSNRQIGNSDSGAPAPRALELGSDCSFFFHLPLLPITMDCQLVKSQVDLRDRHRPRTMN
jgi:hypothetical protein